MEMVGAFLDEEWESLSEMFSGGECDGGSLFPATGEIPFLAFPENSYNTNFCSISEESSNTTEIERTLFSDEDLVHDNAASFGSMSFYNNGGNLMMPLFSDDAMEDILNSKDADSCKEIKRKYHEAGNDESQKKIPRLSRNTGKKGQKNIEEESKSSCSSEDDSNASQQLINCKGKSKSSRGSATDPQSLYARKRREKINERLKILQNLVPNGTKVDISTMLEEAVQYVKFLQLQIKLLSSDDLWMYAPLAYNGMDIGMYQKISPNLRLQIN